MSEEKTFWQEFSEQTEAAWSEQLSRLLQFDTVSGDPDPEAHRRWKQKIAEGFAHLDALAKSLGFVTRNYDDRVLVIDHPGPKGAPVLGFPIHLDVVPAGEGWKHDPFGGEIADGAVWGRGAQDDKGPIIEALYALVGAVEWARRNGLSFTKTVRLIIVSEEELGVWDDIPFYFEHEEPPTFSIVPDAWFPITVGEKGFLNLELKIEWEPALEDRFAIEAGERPNVVPAKAQLDVGPGLLEGLENFDQFSADLDGAPQAPAIESSGEGLKAEFYGIGSHGSTPRKGYNAARDALAKADALPALRSHPAGRILAWMAEAAGDLDGSFLGIKHRHPKVGSTTVNLGVLRVDRSSVRATLNIRNPIGLTCKEVEERVRSAVQKIGTWTSGVRTAEVTPGLDGREPIYIEPEQFAEWITPMREAYTTVTGREAKLETIGGTTFAKAFPNAVCFGPVDPADEEELAHQAEEHVTLAAMRRNVEIYGRTIVAIAL